MQLRNVGQSDLTVTPICLGCWEFANDFMWHGQTEADSINTIHAALDHRINFLDTAESYGDGYSEEVVGRALQGRRDQVVLAGKVSADNLAPDAIRAACEASLRRLKIDYMDLYQIHWPNREIPIAESVGALERLQEAGKIRALGVSNFGPEDMADLLAVTRPAANQIAYSLLMRAVEYAIQPQCVEEEIGLLCYSPLMHGMLAGKFSSAAQVPDERARTRHFSSTRPMTVHSEAGCEEATFAALAEIRAVADDLGCPMVELALAWLIHRPGVTSVIAGARNPAQVAQIARAGERVLSAETMARLDAATEPVKEALGANPDMWRTESRIR